ncbi:MAG: BMP family ABC transporter substrate-binding protein [Anaerolineae bacterium]|jgi:simple sugar transport system substrate-binding protein
MKVRNYLVVGVLVAALLLSACGPAEPETPEEFVFGMILVGPKNDRGWSQAHYEAGQYIEENVEGAKMVVFESLNPADAPEATVEGVVDEMVEQGAQLIFTTSDEFEEDTVGAAKKYPDVTFISSSGDDAWSEGQDAGVAPSNEGNLMGRIEPMKAVAGCAAAMKTNTGQIGYLGPLINFETRRLVASAYLGARYCYENYRGMNPDDLEFTVTWIGFWFNIPGVTLDPTEVVNQFIDSGIDVVISGIDTTEAVVVAGQRADAGEDVMAVGYDYKDGCAEAPDICLGVPYFNWGPMYLETARAVIDGTWKQSFEWRGPDWDDINNETTSNAGWVFGPGLEADAEASATVQEFIDGLASGDINVWTGPINLQDGTEYIPAGRAATDVEIWYLPQLPEGVTGASE